MQQQVGSSSCGVFSIPFAYHAAKNDNLGIMTFNQDTMWQHVISCLENNKFSSFPSATQPDSIKRIKRQHLFIHLHCTCRLPECYDSTMIECNKWFHRKLNGELK